MSEENNNDIIANGVEMLLNAVREGLQEGEDEEEKLSEKMVLPVIPLRGISVFPNMVIHFDIGREKSINALDEAMIRNQRIFLVTQTNESTDLPTVEELYRVGTVAKVKQMLKLPGDSVRVLAEGECRGHVLEYIRDDSFFEAICECVEDSEKPGDEQLTTARMRSVLSNFEKYLSVNRKLPGEMLASVSAVRNPGRLCDVIASHMNLKVADNQAILEAFDVTERLEKLDEIIKRETEILKIERDLSVKTKKQIDKNQREYYLREQMKVIQDELDSEVEEDESESWKKEIEAKNIPEKTANKINKEIARLKRMQPGSAEGGVIRTYIETLIGLPWNKSSDAELDIRKAEKILNEDHYGLEKVKDRILEYLAVVQLSGGLKGPILCLVGPPGVGKTSVAKSIARATNREFVRMSLGGVRDEAEIRGHRRTYIGAIPGRIINAIKDAGTNNPLFLLDEIDKLGNDYRGDPSSALLEVLDPEQNKDFVDHYLEEPFDLSKVMFITTANTLDTVPRPLLDRMEVIHVPGYTEEEKLNIAERYLVPKKVKEHGFTEEEIKFEEQAIRDIINYYTRESGVRNLEREIANVCRKVARKIVEDEQDGEKEVGAAANEAGAASTELSEMGRKVYEITSENLTGYLGKRKFRYDKIGDENQIGVVTGLAWTAVGGDTLSIECSIMPGNGRLQLTGQLGDVMQESAKAGMSYVRSISEELGIDAKFYRKNDMHIHVPEGATPKDGPSAGVTMFTAAVSALTGKAARNDVAMTGEITLRGKVLPVGGIREKVLAAHRAGINKVLLPAENEKDLEDIPENVRGEMSFVFLNYAREALDEALV